MRTIESIAIYVHVPFCRAKCHYCDFPSYAGLSHLIPDYVSAVTREAERRTSAGGGTIGDNVQIVAKSVYFGGGTPSLLSLDQFERLLVALPPRLPSSEITVEANPATVSADFLAGLRSLGINRLSLGMQALDDRLLQRIGRLHNATEAMASYDMARTSGFDEISIDLMFGLPDQSLANWNRTLRHAIELAPEHISLYGLTVEEETAFGRWHSDGRLEVPGEDVQADMYVLAEECLDAAGFKHYEISNWAAVRDGRPRYARHNLVYWRNEPYLGLGAAAHSYLRGRRFANTRDVAAYLKAASTGQSAEAFSEELGRELEMGETMMLGLRLAEGVTRERFQRRFGCSLDERYGRVIEELCKAGLLVATTEGIALTSRGRLLGNEAFRRFLPDARP